MTKRVWFDDYIGNWYGYVSHDGHISDRPSPATGGIIFDPDKLTLDNRLDAFIKAEVTTCSR